MQSLNLKNINIKLLSEKKLDSDLLKKIILIKKQYWKYSYDSHLKWHSLNIKKNHKHFLVLNNSKLIFYLLCRSINCEVNTEKLKLNSIDFVCIDKNFKGKKLSSNFMEIFFNQFKKDIFILTCEDSLKNFYSKFNFKQLKQNIDFYYRLKKQRIMLRGFKSKIESFTCNHLF